MKEKEMRERDRINLQLKKKKKIKNLREKGITLIALVTTIIILLILAGVTISQIAGSNGLFQRARQAVEKYKNSAEEEQIQIGMLEQYVSDFSVVGGDEAKVSIKELTVTGNTEEKKITVNLTIEGEANKIEYSINNGKEWITEEEKGKTQYTHIFEGLDLGKSYIVRVKVYDEEGKYVEAISDIVTLSNEMTATEADVLETKTFLAKDGSVLTGQMKNNGAINETLSAGGEKTIPAGYTSGGTITVKSLKDLTPGTAGTSDILSGKTAYVNGNPVTGNMGNFSGSVKDATSSKDYNYQYMNIPANGYYTTNSKLRIPNSQNINLICDLSEIQTNSVTLTKTHTYTATAPGYVLVYFLVTSNNGTIASKADVWCKKNGTLLDQTYNSQSEWIRRWYYFVKVNTGDTIEGYVSKPESNAAHSVTLSMFFLQ